MKVLFILSVLCITLALCQAACFRLPPKTEIRNGVVVPQDSCIDPHDGNRHPIGSSWNTHDCLECTCLADGGMDCCHRYGGVAVAPPGCKAVVNPKTCRYEMYLIDNPLEPCSLSRILPEPVN